MNGSDERDPPSEGSEGIPPDSLSGDNIPFDLSLSPAAAPVMPATINVLSDAADAAIFETFVIPHYLAPFAELAVSMLRRCPNPRVAYLLSRTGYPDRDIVARLPGARIHGFDPSPYAVELANVKAASSFDLVAEYAFSGSVPGPLPEGVFSHALVLNPLVSAAQRLALYEEAARLLRPDGQLVFALPVRGSFIEIYDLLREYGLKTEAVGFDDKIARAIELRPTVETFGVELEDAGFVDVEVELSPVSIPFRNARDFFESPATRLLILPDVRAPLEVAGDVNALSYVREAITKYWSDTDFELSINIASATARKP